MASRDANQASRDNIIPNWGSQSAGIQPQPKPNQEHQPRVEPKPTAILTSNMFSPLAFDEEERDRESDDTVSVLRAPSDDVFIRHGRHLLASHQRISLLTTRDKAVLQMDQIKI